MRLLPIAGVAVLLTAVLAHQPAPDPSPPGGHPPAGVPAVIVALGDSLTTAATTCTAFWYCEDNGWATGTNPAVDSHYRRLQTAYPAAGFTRENFAQPGAGSEMLYHQAEQAVAVRAQYITILIGANDACRWPMTSARTYRSRLGDALGLLREKLPKAQIQVVSIPDLYHLWEIGHRNLLALAAWRSNECPSLMTRPDSAAPADLRRRREVADRVDAFDAALRQACHRYRQTCRWDGGAVHRAQFTLDMVSVDYFHPNLLGQRKIAELTSRTWTSTRRRTGHH